MNSPRTLSFPKTMLVSASLLSALTLVWLSWTVYDGYEFAATTKSRYIVLARLRGKILHYDEALTMSARMAAATGDTEWVERYHAFNPLLTAALNDSMALSQSKLMQAAMHATAAADAKLISIESAALDLVLAGRPQEAQTLLSSDTYQAQKRIYADGMDRLVTLLDAEVAERVADHQKRLVLTIFVAAAAVFASLGSWWFVFRRINQWRHVLSRGVEGRAAAEKALSLAQRQAHIGNWGWDVAARKLISFSDEYARIHGVTVEEVAELMDAQMERVIHPDDRKRVAAAFERFDKESIDYEIDYRIVRPDGEIRHVFEIGEAILDHDGQAVEQRGTVQDITAQKAVEEELRLAHHEMEQRVEVRTAELGESERRYRAILETAMDCVISIDPEGRIIEWNAMAQQSFGYARDAAIGRAMAELIVPPSLRDAHHAGLKRYLDTNKATVIGQRTNTVGLRSDGTEFPVELAITAQKGDTGQFFTAHLRDITKERQAEDRLRQAQKMEAVGQLTGGVAHDFNNLLAVIMGNAELLEMRMGKHQPLKHILQAATRGAELTQRLLSFSRQQPLRPKVVELGVLVSGLYDLLVRTLGETIEIETKLAPDLWNASADPGQIESALLNLAINARDAMPGGGKLIVECSNARFDHSYVEEFPEAIAGDYVLLAVSDDGTGMSDEVKAHAFEPFFTTKEIGQGSGLGLSMVYGFAKQSDGHVTLYSEEGIGTTARLYLPRSSEVASGEGTIADEKIPQGRGETILVVEDDPDVRKLAVRMLENLSYRVIDVPDAASADRVLSKEASIDLVLSDVILSGGSTGPEFAEAACAIYPDLKIVFMSGYSAHAARSNSFLESDQVLLSKPFQQQQLARVVREKLTRKTET